MPYKWRVHIVYNSRWAIAKQGHGDCALEVVPVSAVESRSLRRRCDYRWLITKGCADEGYLIRNDHHPRRALRGGIPLMLQLKNSSDRNQRWEFEFVDGEGGLNRPFYLRSVISKMYLIVDEAARMPMLQKDPPKQTWQLHDASGATAKLLRKLGTAPHLPAELVPAKALCVTEADADSDDSEFGCEEEQLATFDGDAAGAFGEDSKKSGSPFTSGKNFTPVEVLLQHQITLCESEEIFSGDFDFQPADVFEIFFSCKSKFPGRYQELRKGRNVQRVPTQVSSEASWHAASSLTCSVPVPVLGLKQYEEDTRIALCSTLSASSAVVQSTTHPVLVVQQVGNVDTGSFGCFRNESLFVFFRPEGNNAPVLLTAFAVRPEGRFSSKAVDGYNQALADFLKAVKLEMLAWKKRSRGGSEQSAMENGAADPAESPSTPHGAVSRLVGCFAWFFPSCFDGLSL
eukprot:TRINITY_DN56395_c0_g1_i1.p1 TRINITY_DN56395_c0_g1~~TRINITY_DN56395_c0_g1_i1.p1  ORF type:complete len:458 (+),score=94.68 TRINITY_DN56395_c0_g1_i1:104-1477(+)